MSAVDHLRDRIINLFGGNGGDVAPGEVLQEKLYLCPVIVQGPLVFLLAQPSDAALLKRPRR